MLYTVFGGVPPEACLPIALDVGTNNKVCVLCARVLPALPVPRRIFSHRRYKHKALLADPNYRGLRQPRLAGDAFNELVAELIGALTARWPKMLLQFEARAKRKRLFPPPAPPHPPHPPDAPPPPLPRRTSG